MQLITAINKGCVCGEGVDNRNIYYSPDWQTRLYSARVGQNLKGIQENSWASPKRKHTWSLNGREANEAKFLVHLTAINSSLAAVSQIVSELFPGATVPVRAACTDPGAGMESPPTETEEEPSEEQRGGD